MLAVTTIIEVTEQMVPKENLATPPPFSTDRTILQYILF